MVQLGIYSQATYTRVIFHTDNSTVDDGFRLNYKAVSGTTVTVGLVFYKHLDPDLLAQIYEGVSKKICSL